MAGSGLSQLQSLGWGDPLEEEMATLSSILAWKIPWTELGAGGEGRHAHGDLTSLAPHERLPDKESAC